LLGRFVALLQTPQINLDEEDAQTEKDAKKSSIEDNFLSCPDAPLPSYDFSPLGDICGNMEIS